MLIASRLEELRGDSHAPSRANDRSFHDGIHVQFSGNFRQTFFCAFVPQDGSPRDDAQRADLGEVSNQLVGHAIRKEFLGRVAGQIVEG